MKRQGYVPTGRKGGKGRSRGKTPSVAKETAKAADFVKGVLVLSDEEFASIQKCSATPQQPTEAMVAAANLHRQFGAKN